MTSRALPFLLMLLTLSWPQLSDAAPGDLVADFGVPVRPSAFGDADFAFQDASAASDGGIWITGCRQSGAPVLVKLLSIGGGLDESFGSGGVVETQNFWHCPRRVAELADGSVLVVSPMRLPSGDYSIVAMRRDAVGSLVGTYGSGGIAVFSLGGTYGYPSSILIEPSGAVVVLGAVGSYPYTWRLARIDAWGSVDVGFGTSGFSDLGSGAAAAFASVASDPQGRLFVGGRTVSSGRGRVLRLSPTGQVDSTYGTLSVAEVPALYVVDHLAAMSDGSVVVLGPTLVGDPPQQVWTNALAKVTASGTLDAAYGEAGTLLLPSDPIRVNFEPDQMLVLDSEAVAVVGPVSLRRSSNAFDAAALVVLPDGSPDLSFNDGTLRTVFLGDRINNDVRVVPTAEGGLGLVVGAHSTRLAHLLADGSLDPQQTRLGVSVSGLDDIDFDDYESPASVEIAEGRILVAATRQRIVNGAWSLAASELTAFTPDGLVDTTFGDRGKIKIDEVQDLAVMRLDRAGRILVSGTWDAGKPVVARLDHNGSPDPSFGGTGYVRLPMPAGEDFGIVRDVSTDEDGKVLVGVLFATLSPLGLDRGVYRLEEDGALDMTFGTDGLFRTDVNEDLSADAFRSIALTPTGILLSGRNILGVTRDGDVDLSFGTGGMVEVNGHALALQNDGRVLVLGDDEDGFSITRLLSSGALDVTFGVAGRASAPQGAWLRVLRVQADDKILVGGALNANVHSSPDVAVIRFTADGELDASFGLHGVSSVPLGRQSDTSEDPTALAFDDGLGIVLASSFSAGGSSPGYRTMLSRHEVGPICGDGVAQGDEVCDVGTVSARCCTKECRIAAFGSVCRAAVSTCDIEETCDGGSPFCPLDAAAPVDTPCADDGNACTTDACDGGGACAHDALSDADGDSVCDEQDVCTNVAGGRDFVTKPRSKVVLAKVNTDVVSGNDQLTIGASFVLPALRRFGDLDPQARGARLLLRTGAVQDVVDVWLPGGAYAGKGTRGWRTNARRSYWQYLDKTSAPLAGIIGLKATDRGKGQPGGLVAVAITGKNGNYAVVPGDAPLSASVTLGDRSDAASGMCGERAYTADECGLNGSGDVLKCLR